MVRQPFGRKAGHGDRRRILGGRRDFFVLAILNKAWHNIGTSVDGDSTLKQKPQRIGDGVSPM